MSSLMRPLMLPREHGAYGQLLFPLATTHLMGGINVAGAMLSVACFAAFALNEPLSVIIGRRGTRTQRETGKEARIAAGVWLSLALVAGLCGIWQAPPAARVAVVALAVLALGAAAAVVWGREKTLWGELYVTLCLVACSVPVALSVGLGRDVAVSHAALWLTGFVASTLVVRSVLGRNPGYGATIALLMVATAGWGVAGLVAAVPVQIAAAWLPFLASNAWVVLARPPASQLRRLGWSLVGASFVVLAVLALGGSY